MIKFYPHKPGYFDDHGEPLELTHIAEIQLHIDISPFIPIYKIPYPSVYRPYEYKIVSFVNEQLITLGYIDDGRNINLPEWETYEKKDC